MSKRHIRICRDCVTYMDQLRRTTALQRRCAPAAQDFRFEQLLLRRLGLLGRLLADGD